MDYRTIRLSAPFTVVLLLWAFACTYGQKKPATAPQQTKQVQQAPSKNDPIVFTTSWGPVLSGQVAAVQVAAVASAPLFVKDNLGKAYEVTSFRINYKFKTTYKDQEQGVTRTIDELRVSEYSSAKLPDFWSASIKDNIKPGDSILFNKVLFRNGMGKLQLAPDLRIAAK